jgi:hypothetical protein
LLGAGPAATNGSAHGRMNPPSLLHSPPATRWSKTMGQGLILWLLGVPGVIVILLPVTHII